MDTDTWGLLGHLTAEQEAVLEKMRQHVKENGFPSGFEDDKLLLRFCRARKFKAKQVINMLNKNRKFVEEFKDRPLGINQYPGIKEYFLAGIIRVGGVDKSNRPIVYYKPPLCFPARLGFCHDAQALRHFFAFYFTRLSRVADDNGADSWNFIIDLKGWTFANFSMTFARYCLSILQDQFPERLGVVHVVFSPAVFKAAWRILSSMMEPRTRSKFNFISVKEFGRILNYIDKDVLEQVYGGDHEPYPVKDIQYKGLVGAEVPRPIVEDRSPLATASAISLFEEVVESEREEVESKTSERELEKRSRMTFMKSRKRMIQYSTSSVDDTKKQQYLLGALKSLESALKEDSQHKDKQIEDLQSTTESITSAYKNDLFLLQKQVQESEKRVYWLQLVVILLSVIQAYLVVPWIWETFSASVALD